MATIGALGHRGLGLVVHAVAARAVRARVSLAGLRRVGVILCVIAAVWFSEGGPRGAAVGALFLCAVLFTDAVATALPDRDALGTWLSVPLARLGEYAVYVGLAIGGTVTGVPDVWAWASGALVGLALRDSVAHACGAPARRAGNGPSPLELADPSRASVDRAPGDASLTSELLGDDSARSTGAYPMPSAPRGRKRSRRVPLPSGRGRAVSPRWMAFPRPARFAAVAGTALVWDARVTFIVLIIGCFVAVTGELAAAPDRRPAGG